jgi:hypothetical protein
LAVERSRGRAGLPNMVSHGKSKHVITYLILVARFERESDKPRDFKFLEK